MNWDDLRFFLSVARTGTLSGAAREIGVNHATVLRRLRALEEELETALFERRADGYGLTAAGEEILKSAGRIEDEALAIARTVSGRDVRLSGPVRIATVDTFSDVIIAPHLPAFAARYPGITIELFVADQHANLSRREADIALRPSNNPGDTMVGRRIGRLGFALYAARDSNWTLMAERAGEPLRILTGDGVLDRLAAMRWFRERMQGAAEAMRANSFLTLAAACRAGAGIACLPTYLGGTDPLLRRLEDAPEDAGTDIWLLTPPELRKTARIRAVLDWLAEIVSRQVP